MGKTKVVVIGGGPGGYVAAIRAAQLGGQVVLVEKEHIGGTCLNIGCIPTKALLHTAEVYEEAKNGSECGVVTNVKLDFSKAQSRKNVITKQLVDGVKSLLAANKVKVISGLASFSGRDTIHVKTKDGKVEELRADRFIIATGSVPVMPQIPGIDAKQCIDSTGALELREIPKRMVIIGGGVIGVEFATLYGTLGCQVTIVEMQKEILPMMDGELTKILRSKLAQRNVNVYTESKVISIKDEGTEAKVTVELSDGTKKVFSCEKALISVGRKTNTEALELDRAGVLNDRGRITVNEQMETNVKGIYAIGDCTGKSMLAHVASAHGEVAAENALGHKSSFDIKTNPSCVYTNPEFASVGLTEEMAKEQNIDYIVGKFPLFANGKSLIMDGGTGMIKLIVGKEFKEILGAHIIGPRATDLIAECALAIGLEATVDEVIATIHAHPTVGEAIREAALAEEQRAIHIPNKKAGLS
ncbi:dihydrolipoyl dehydrogenase [Priestia megaterium]|uniref:dihydrolipoyl dehydrogenase n=1 Tax=Priestia megaterium TaxID=1404 RepID=UPI001781B809|nr:dihydrolipoyl dehydrogenase [Priestia megaterium]MBD8847886.1 dihydrolipoyl dehydrogenase [Priestia megaterium]MCF6799806.1 dihydrolipoyl dehydrogenase [Bacillus sp. ET1]MDN4866017.1 dihydrolipoyl dehydrogenase [Priestia megaterium]MED4184243.1 dihydrolipoyl dehydrogenase [Priestia megaterium]